MKFFHRIVITISLIVVISSCNDSINKKLLIADVCLNNDQVDSAYNILTNINPEKIDKNENFALYALLCTKAKYKKYIPVKNDSIDYAIFYYEQNGPKDRLAEAYNYKGITLYSDQGKSKEAVKYLKKAEALAMNIGTIKLIQKIDENICTVNMYTCHYAKSLEYGMKALEYARKLRDTLCIAYDFSYISSSYSGLGNSDSTFKYEVEILPYLKYFCKTDQSILLSNLSSLYLEKGNTEKAERFLKKALQQNPTTYSYAIAADILIKRGQYALALTIMRKSPLPTNNIEKQKKLSTLFNLYRKSGNYDQALCTADTIFVQNQQMEKIKENDNMNEIQAKYDSELVAHKLEVRAISIVGALLLLILLMVLFIFRQKYKAAKVQQSLMKNRLLINDYKKRIAEMENSQGTSTTQISKLEAKINKLESKEAKVAFNGKRCYDHVLINQTVSHWSKQDFLDFLNYYKLIDFPYVSSLEEDYYNLTPYQSFFMILVNRMNKDEAMSERILCIRDSSIRSMKSRINMKKK